MISLPKEPGAALEAAALHIAANDDGLDARDVVEACAAEIEARGFEVSRPDWWAALNAVREHQRDRAHRWFVKEADRLAAKGKLTGRLAEMAEESRAHVRASGGGAADAAPAAVAQPAPLALSPRLKRITYQADLAAAPPAWLVKGLVPRGGLGMLYGESQAGKTFLAVHMALCVAYGLDFFGRRVKQGGVVIVAAEGGASVITRLRAAERALAPSIGAANLARKAAGLPPLSRAPIDVVAEPPNLGPGGSPGPLNLTIADAAASIERVGHRMALVIVDTLHASMGSGDENSASDVGAVLRPTRRLSEEYGCHLMFLHHPGKDLERGARGSNSLFAAMDAVVELRVPGHEGQKPKSDALRRATVVKLRDGETGTAFAYRLPVVEIGQDEDGDPLTTCHVEPVVAAEQPEPGVRLPGQARDLLAQVRGMIGEEGSANLARVREAFGKTLKPGTKEDAERKAWKRATEALAEAGLIELDQEANQISLIGP